MKLILSVLLLAAFAQNAQSSIIGGVLDLGTVQELLVSTVSAVTATLTDVVSNVLALVDAALETVFDLVDDLLSTVAVLLDTARTSNKSVDDCADLVIELELVKNDTLSAVEACEKTLNATLSSVSAELESQLDSGNAVISAADVSATACLANSLTSTSCLLKLQVSVSLSVQENVDIVNSLSSTISLAEAEAETCISNAKGNATQQANQITNTITTCISNAS